MSSNINWAERIRKVNRAYKVDKLIEEEKRAGMGNFGKSASSGEEVWLPQLRVTYSNGKETYLQRVKIKESKYKIGESMLKKIDSRMDEVFSLIRENGPVVEINEIGIFDSSVVKKEFKGEDWSSVILEPWLKLPQVEVE
jgi:hypothetical protein